MERIKAKLFNNGRSQAVRLPVACRFSGSEVYIYKDQDTGEVILSQRPDTWDEFFALLDSVPESEKRDFLRDRDTRPPQGRDLI